jgi:spermidine synthase
LAKRSPIFLMLFAVSGATGLIYEVVWTRLFTVIIGNTVSSVSSILTVFMAGLALGSWISGRLVDRQPMRFGVAYAALELTIGLYNLSLPFLLKTADPVFAALYLPAYQSAIGLGLVRAGISFLLLIVPATLMGATLPILVRLYADNVSKAGAETGRLYAANTLGAAAGAAFAGFLLVPALGTLFALRLAAALNIAIALTAWTISRRERVFVPPSHERKTESGARLVLLAMLFSGFAALMDEVAWTRVLALAVGPTTYAFTLMLCSMIAGLGVGAAFGSRWMRKGGATPASLAWIELGIGVFSLSLVPVFGRLPLWIGLLVAQYSASFRTMQSLELFIFFALMALPTFLFGLTFPVATRIYAKSDSLLGTEVGAVYAFNTLGGIAGSLAAGFLLIPTLGSQSTMIAAALLNIGVCAFLAPRWMPRAMAVVAFCGSFLIPRWNLELIASGAYKYAPGYSSRADLETALGSGELLYFKEGATTAVSVRKFRGALSLSVDGKVDATDAGDMTTQKMLAHLPLLMSKEPKSVAIVGLGSGVTAAAALSHPIEKLDIVEISPEVIDASRLFSHVNHGAVSDPRTEMIIGDGRNHLRYTTRRYDVIISEPSNPWMSGMASLFTREFFSEARSRLLPGGIHCQWFHSYNMSLDDLRTVVATFRSVFPHAALWAFTRYDFLMLGSSAPINVDEERFAMNFTHVAEDLAQIRIRDTYSVLSSLMLRDEELDRFASDAVLNTDDLPVLEFRAPLSLYANTTEENLRALKSVAHSTLSQRATAENHRHKADMLAAAEDLDSALDEFKTAITVNPDDVEAMISAADLHLARDDNRQAARLLDQVLQLDPTNVRALERLANALADQGDPRITEVTDRLLKAAPENPTGLYHRASMYLLQGRFDEAATEARRSLQGDPKSTRTRHVLAVAYERTFQPDKAEAEFRRATIESPEDWVSCNNYGIFLLEKNRISEALQQFQRAVHLNPENVQGFLGISEALMRTGRTREAEKWRQKALRLSPGQQRPN